MEHGFPRIAGLSKETGYAALMLAKSDALCRLAESELRKFENLSNTILLVKMPRRGVSVTPELIAAAQTLSVKEFRQLAGYGKKATVEAVVESPEVARELQPIQIGRASCRERV